MALNALLALRQTLIYEATLNDYCGQHFGKPPKHGVGYKRAANANNYPVLSYVPVQTRGDGTINETEVVSVVIGVNEPKIEGDVMLGHVRVAELADLIVTAIRPGPLLGGRALYMDKFKINGDLGERHPFYELELQLQLLWRRR